MHVLQHGLSCIRTSEAGHPAAAGVSMSVLVWLQRTWGIVAFTRCSTAAARDPILPPRKVMSNLSGICSLTEVHSAPSVMA